MSVTEHERHQLYNWFEEQMGPERAETMMRLVPPVGWGDVATRADIERLEERLELRFDARLEAVESRLLRTIGTWLFASQVAVIAVVSVLVTLD